MNILSGVGIFVLVFCYFYVGRPISNYMYDTFHSRTDKPDWKMYVFWPIATISDRRNLRRNDPNFNQDEYDDCYRDSLPNKVSRNDYIFIMNVFWGFMVIFNLFILLVVALLLSIMLFGAALTFIIAYPFMKLFS